MMRSFSINRGVPASNSSYSNCLLTVVVGVLLLIFSVSCGNLDKEIVRNRGNLPKLRLGMTKDEVRAVMGNPVTGQKYCRPNIWFYYTDCKWSDSMITADECTPVVFDKDGKVCGWGREYYKNHFLTASWY